MAYSTDLPPTISQTGDSTFELRSSTGSVIATYNQTEFRSPDDWWEDILTFVATNSATNIGAVNDITLLMIKRDWSYVDER